MKSKGGSSLTRGLRMPSRSKSTTTATCSNQLPSATAGASLIDSALLTDLDRAKQHRILLTFTENRYTNAVTEPDAYRTPVAALARTYELIKVHSAAEQPGVTNLFRFKDLALQVARASDGSHDLPYEDVDAKGATQHHPYRRLLDENRVYYRADRLDRILHLGVIEPMALPGESFALAFTPGLIAPGLPPPRAARGLDQGRGACASSRGQIHRSRP